MDAPTPTLVWCNQPRFLAPMYFLLHPTIQSSSPMVVYKKVHSCPCRRAISISFASPSTRLGIPPQIHPPTGLPTDCRCFQCYSFSSGSELHSLVTGLSQWTPPDDLLVQFQLDASMGHCHPVPHCHTSSCYRVDQPVPLSTHSLRRTSSSQMVLCSNSSCNLRNCPSTMDPIHQTASTKLRTSHPGSMDLYPSLLPSLPRIYR
jgi:hypothetical protein